MPGESAPPTNGAGTPPRTASQDVRLEGMPDDLSKEAQSDFIKEKCDLRDAMWAHVARSSARPSLRPVGVARAAWG